VLAMGVEFMGFRDCTITSLVEHPQNPMGGRHVYMQIFSGGKMVVQIHGTPDTSGRGDVIQAVIQ